jgi:hypothetical protein
MIELRALNSTSDVLVDSVLTVKCDESGNYDFQLGNGAYDVYAQNDYQGDMDYLGSGMVSASSIDGALFNILVDGGRDITPPFVEVAQEAANRASVSAAAAATDREQTGVDARTSSEMATTATTKAGEAAISEREAKAARDSIVNDVADVRQKAVAVESARQEVVSNTATVSANTTTASTFAAEAARDAATALESKIVAKAAADKAETLKAAVEAIRDNVNGNVSTATAAADTASQKAASAAQSEATASSAAIRAEQAAQIVAGALIDAGPYDASTGVLPSPIQVSGANKSCIWKVTGAGTTGGIELGVGDSLVYTTHGSSYYKIDNSESVTSINGRKGIVVVSAETVGADPEGTAADLIQQHEARNAAHTVSGVGGLQELLDSKLDALGNAASAAKLYTARKITVGAVEKTFDGSNNVSFSLIEIGAASASHTHDDYVTGDQLASVVDSAVAGIKNNLFPVGHVLITINSSNPSSYGYPGSWEMVEADTTLSAVTSNAGVVTGNNNPVVPLPAHSHSAWTNTVNLDHQHYVSGHTSGGGGHSHTTTPVTLRSGTGSSGTPPAGSSASSSANFSQATGAVGDHSHSVEVWSNAMNANQTHSHTIGMEEAGIVGATIDVRGKRFHVYFWQRIS